MEKYYKVIEQTLGLLDILEEGIEHIQKQVLELRIEEALTLLEDTSEAFGSIEAALQPIMPELTQPETIQKTNNKMMKSFSLVVKEFENKNIGNTLDAIELSLEPCFKMWKSELEKQLRFYIAS